MTAAVDTFRLYANCVPVKGARRSIICDLQRLRAQFIPNGLYYILTELAGKSISEIKRFYHGKYDQIINEYFDLLIEKDYGFWCEEPESFPPLDLTWDRPESVTNAIIDIDRNSKHDYARIFSSLNDVGCEAVQIRAYDELSINELESMIQASQFGLLRHLELMIKYQPELTQDYLVDLSSRHQVIAQILVHSSPHRAAVDSTTTFIKYSTQSLCPNSCGEVSPGYFSISLEHFAESQSFNSCLNRKIGIAADGEIKSCPAMKQSYGHINQAKLSEVVKSPALVQISRITKDQVAVCKDCEFRYICTDCRAFTSESSVPYGKPAKCAYDPYTAMWKKSPQSNNHQTGY